ncbi:MAG: hypothetical protein G01um101466_363 [Parcubacteria group bacterium Gr01-1014_66]|nr:MAG: hypothetical protein G01um101466_363 [Parcubacteria group bacterium Gr01-1014_66]
MLHTWKAWFERNEKWVGPIGFLTGFIFDNLTLTRVDQWLDNLIIAGYIILTGLCIVILNLYSAGRIQYRIVEKYVDFLPFVLQFAFGNLFSAFVVFYTRSGSLAGSWLFLLVLVVLFIGNERFRRWYGRFVFQISIFFIAVFTYSVVIVPVLLRRIGPWIFIIGGGISLLLICVILYGMWRLIPERIWRSRYLLGICIGGIYLLFHLFYFTNIIPPIPLALKESGVYHLIVPTGYGGYRVTFEPAPWYMPFHKYSTTYHQQGETGVAYAYAAVFAPRRLTAKIVHHWRYFDEKKGRWVDGGEFGYEIVGGRDNGWRGYTLKQRIFPGRWRVDIATDRGQILGRIKFKVVQSDIIPKLVTETR